MIQTQRCWVCGDLAAEEMDDIVLGRIFMCDTHFKLAFLSREATK